MNVAFLFRLVIFTVSCVAILSCRKTRHDNIKNELVVEGATFKEESYFIYRDSVTKVEDSFFVWMSFDGVGVVRDEGTTFDYIGYELTNGKDDLIVQARGRRDGTDILICTFRPEVDSSNFNMVFLKFPFINSSSGTFGSCTYELQKHDAELLVNNVKYQNIFIIRSQSPTVKGELIESLSYYSPVSGLVKFVITGKGKSTVFELVRSKVIK